MTTRSIALLALIVCGCGGSQPAHKPAVNADPPPPKKENKVASERPEPKTMAQLKDLDAAQRNKAIFANDYYTPARPEEIKIFHAVVLPTMLATLGADDAKNRAIVIERVRKMVVFGRSSVGKNHDEALGVGPDGGGEYFANTLASQKELINGLATAVGSVDASIRHDAAGALIAFGPLAKGAIPTLRPVLKSENPEIRALAAEVLWFTNRDGEAFESLVHQLRSDGEREQKAALRALRLIWERDTEERFYEDRGIYENFYFLKHLQHLDRTAADADRFASTPGCVRNLLMLENNGTPYREAHEILRELAYQGSTAMLPSLDEAFKVVEHDASKKTIVELMVIMVENKNPRIRQKAAESLGRLGSAGEPAVPVLVRALRDDDLDARYAAGQALKAINPDAAKRALVP